MRRFRVCGSAEGYILEAEALLLSRIQVSVSNIDIDDQSMECASQTPIGILFCYCCDLSLGPLPNRLEKQRKIVSVSFSLPCLLGCQQLL